MEWTALSDAALARRRRRRNACQYAVTAAMYLAAIGRKRWLGCADGLGDDDVLRDLPECSLAHVEQKITTSATSH